MLEKLVKDFLILWTTIDPIGTLVLFTALTARFDQKTRHKIALQATLIATAILVVCVFLGQLILTGMGIKLISLQVAGGIILFIFALKMVFGNIESDMHPEAGHNIAVFPLAIPSIATPGAIIAVILITDNHLYTLSQQLFTLLVLGSVMAITYGMMRLSSFINNLIGLNGSNILVRVMGMLLAALSVELVMAAMGLENWINK